MSSDDGHTVHDTSDNSYTTTSAVPSGSLSPNKALKQPMNAVYPDLNLKEDKISQDIKPSVTRPIGLPIAYTTKNSQNETTLEDIKKKYVERAREIKGCVVGPMPEASFFDRFLPYNADTGSRAETHLDFQSHEIFAGDLMANVSQEEAEPSRATKLSAFDSTQLPIKVDQEPYKSIVSIW